MSSKNEEKAHAMLNRWVAIKKELNSRSKEKRPKLSTECNNLQDCERWRNQIIKEITKKVADIQNASLGEYRIREMNDDINKLFREKGHWEDRIKKLGGADYKKLVPKAINAEGSEVPNSGGYKYWGAAKDLPGVRELFAIEAPNEPRKNLMDYYKAIDYEYYGDEIEDEEMLNEEKDAEGLLYLEYIAKQEEDEMNTVAKKQKVNEKEARIMEKRQKAIVSDEEYEEFKQLHSGYNLIKKGDNTQLTEEEIQKSIVEKKKGQILRMLTNL